MVEILLVGAGGHASACIDVVELTKKFKVAGLIEKVNSEKKEYMGYQIVGTDVDLQKLRPRYNNALISVGQIKSSDTRVRLYKLLKKIGFKMPPIISPKAYVSKYAHVGEGSIVMHGAIVNANAKIGKNCIINSRALIEHEATIGDHCHIATGSIINGNVSVEDEVFIGSGVVTRNGIFIGAKNNIGAGVVLKSNVD